MEFSRIMVISQAALFIIQSKIVIGPQTYTFLSVRVGKIDTDVLILQTSASKTSPSQLEP